MSITYVDIDYSGRVAAIIAVGTALGAPTNLLPAPWASPGEFLCLQYINNLRVFMGEAPLTNLDYTGFQAALNALSAMAPAPPATPVVTPGQTFNITLPVATNQIIGSVAASNSPTAFAINPPNTFFAISNAGQLTVTALGAAGIAAGMTNIMVEATNAGGTSPAVNVGISAA